MDVLVSGLKYCSNDEAYKWTPTVISLMIGLVICLVQIFPGKKCVIKRCNISLATRRLIKYILMKMTPIVLTLGLIPYFYEMSMNFPSLVICQSPLVLEFSMHAVCNWIRFLVHIYLVLRTLIFWLLEKNTEPLLTVVNVFLFVQSLMGIILQQEFVAFYFLIFLNVFCYEVNTLLLGIGRHRTYHSNVIKLWVGIFVIAGFLRAAEEWGTNFGYHAGFRGLYVPMKSSWSYIYWAVITVSTVGFGDIIPSTEISKAIVMLTIVFSICWFSSQSKILKNHMDKAKSAIVQDNFSIDLRCHLVIGCETVDTLVTLLNAFPKNDLRKVVVFIKENRSYFLRAATRFPVKIVLENDPLKVIKDSHIFRGGEESSIWILYNAVNYDDAPAVDNSTVLLVKRIKDIKCKSRLFVKVTGVEARVQISNIGGWRGTDETDVCIVSQVLEAHMLTHSAHARITAALLADASVKMHLEIQEQGPLAEAVKFCDIATKLYLSKKDLLLGVINETSKVFFPDYIHPGDVMMLLINGETDNKKRFHCGKKGNHEMEHPLLCPDIATTSICYNAVPIDETNKCLTLALSNHPLPADGLPRETIMICTSKLQSNIYNAYDLMKARSTLVDETVISMLEHRYEICLHEDYEGCMCGTFENYGLMNILLMKAYSNPLLYNAWSMLIESNCLVAEEVKDSCQYCCIFGTMVRKQKIPLGIEVNRTMSDGQTVRVPILNPPPTYKVDKGSYVVILRSDKED